jgi:hypothetical protein
MPLRPTKLWLSLIPLAMVQVSLAQLAIERGAVPSAAQSTLAPNAAFVVYGKNLRPSAIVVAILERTT